MVPGVLGAQIFMRDAKQGYQHEHHAFLYQETVHGHGKIIRKVQTGTEVELRN